MIRVEFALQVVGIVNSIAIDARNSMNEFLLILTAVCLLGGSLRAADTDATKPNIIVFYTDDHGYADLGVQGTLADIKTPNIDALARSGVLAKHGYSTAPQCVPSRAGLLVGKFQGRFNRDSNGGSLEGFDQETTIASRLQKVGYVTERTLIFMIGDNGAPLKIHKTDAPLNGDAGGWDGSLNTPLNGEKGMLAEGGMHTPFVVAWPGTIPSGQIYEHPISALDVAATAAALAKIQTEPGDLDGVNLIPHLKRETTTPPHDALYWRWGAQSAIREGNWKLLRGGDREYLYDLGTDLEEKQNLVAKHPDVANRLRAKLIAWGAELKPPGITLGPMAPTWNDYFDHYLEGKTVTGPLSNRGQTTKASGRVEYPNPKCKRGAISQVPHLRIGL